MLDMGFEPQIRVIVDQIRPDRQTLMVGLPRGADHLLPQWETTKSGEEATTISLHSPLGCPLSTVKLLSPLCYFSTATRGH